MNLKHMNPEHLFLPDEALAALAAGEEWKYTPDSVEGADADVHWCDDCETWHQTWSVWGLRLDADGNLYETEHTVDTDGDWSFVDEYPYGTFDRAGEHASVKERWKSYARWVVQHGEDPVGNYYVARARDRSVRWQVQFSDSIVGLVVVVRRRGRGTWLRLTDAPARVREFFSGLEEFASVEDARLRAFVDRWQTRGNRAWVTVTEPNNLSERAYKAKLRAAALRSLEN